jgi:hypothetical protein
MPYATFFVSLYLILSSRLSALPAGLRGKDAELGFLLKTAGQNHLSEQKALHEHRTRSLSPKRMNTPVEINLNDSSSPAKEIGRAYSLLLSVPKNKRFSERD